MCVSHIQSKYLCMGEWLCVGACLHAEVGENHKHACGHVLVFVKDVTSFLKRLNISGHKMEPKIPNSETSKKCTFSLMIYQT